MPSTAIRLPPNPCSFLQFYYLPRKQACQLTFIIAVLTNQKKVYLTKEIRTITVPCWPELSLEKIWKEAVKIPGFLDYMPDDWIKIAKHRERGFFYGIVATLNEQYVEQLVIDCQV